MDSPYASLRGLFEEIVELPPEAQAERVAGLRKEAPELVERLLRLLARDRSSTSDRWGLHEAAARHAIAALAPLAVAPGRRIGAFHIAEQLGAGGMGRVYRAVRSDGQVEQQAALKLVLEEALNPELLRRFSAERRLLAALDHPGICRFLDAGMLDEGTPYVLMELIEGEPFLAYCDRHRLGVEARLRLLRGVLAAVDHAHSNLVVHRDLKSGNVLVTEDGQPKLLDFGIAKLLSDADLGVTATADRFLTPLNAAPEQILGRPTGVACDIYQLGLLAYELLCGDPPFHLAGLRAAEVERLVLEHPPALMSQRTLSDDTAKRRGLASSRALARRLAGDLDAIVLRCLRKAPGERYRSVAELDADLARALDGRPVLARGGERLYRFGRFVARHRLALGFSTALVATVLGASVALAWQAIEANRQRHLAVQERDRAQHAVAVLREAFAAADPARVAGADVRARQILNAARERIEPLFETQPALYVELAETLASVELDLASSTEAADLAARGIEAAEQGRIAGPTLRKLRLVRARALVGAGDFDEAEELLARIEADDGDFRSDRALVQGQLAAITLRTDEAVALLEAALEELAGQDASHELATRVRWELASAFRTAAMYPRGREVLEETLAWQLRALPEAHPRVLMTRLHLFNVRSEGGAGEEAIADIQPTLDLILSHYGEHSSMAAIVHSMLGLAYSRIGRRDESIWHYRRALAGRRVALGDDHASTLRTMLNLAIALARHGRDLDEAEALFRETLALGERRFGPTRAMVVYARTWFARFLGQQGRWGEALRLAVAPEAGLGVATVSRTNRREQAAVLSEVIEGAGCIQAEPTEPVSCGRARELLEGLERIAALEPGV
ncbi:MAG TPA: serine/threonine-protein kinase [Xanthomonadaceae bacterium]|nr:serine/threonine-protein kinase [Xanthomonadaceae bacterium]